MHEVHGLRWKGILLLTIASFAAGCNSNKEATEPAQSQEAINSVADEDQPIATSNASQQAVAPDGAQSHNAEDEPVADAQSSNQHTMTAGEFIASYEQDAEVFQEKYGEADIIISGVAIGVGHETGGPFVEICDDFEEPIGVLCLVKEPRPWSRLVAGQEVTVRGRLPKEMSRAELQSCEITALGPSPAITVSAEALAADYVKEFEATCAKYEGKDVYLTGTVVDTVPGRSIIRLAGQDDVVIECGFQAYAIEQQLPQLSVGDTVQLVGQFGWINHPAKIELTLCLLFEPDDAQDQSQ